MGIKKGDIVQSIREFEYSKRTNMYGQLVMDKKSYLSTDWAIRVHYTVGTLFRVIGTPEGLERYEVGKNIRLLPLFEEDGSDMISVEESAVILAAEPYKVLYG